MSMKKKITRRNFLKASVVAAAAVSMDLTASAAAPQAISAVTTLRSTQYGPVQGTELGESLVWYGIPYGAAPVGELRWCPPQDPAPWSQAKDCTAQSPVAYQWSNGPVGTEDCLKLDVYSTPNANKAPVLVFIHGGNNQTGNTQEIRGTELVVRDECVFVSLDYRLGLFGFNCLPALQTGADSTGNYTLLDIAKALDWVRDNIAQFGGDPDNITVSGFSAGGRDVMAMLVSPMFAGRFQKAIAFSGGMTIADENASASQIAAAVAPLAVEDGLFGDEASAKAWLLTSGADVKDWLYALDSARLCALMGNAGIRMSAFPHLYNDGVVLPKEGFATSAYNSVPLLMLTGSTEFSMFNVFDAFYSSELMSGYDAATVQAAKDFGTKYGSDMYRIFNAECSAEAMYDRYDANIYLCQVEYGSADSLSPITAMGLGSFHGIFVPMLSSVNNYTSYVDFSVPGYQAMAEQFNRYLKNFLITGDPNDDGVSCLGNLKRLLLGEMPPRQMDWKNWTPENKVSMVMDADASQAVLAVKDVSTTYDAILARMDADTTLPAEVKAGVVSKVLNGRWFSAALDAHYGNPSLWK
ncbi:MAG: carboxylesterase family protein [Faecalibacterium sp.]